MTGTTIFAVLAIVVIIAIVLFFRFYRRASKEIAFVRTGLGGEKVVLGGGAIVIPLLQEVVEVNLNTMRLGINLANEQAIISKDRMRVDVVAEFYVHVPTENEAVSTAAATLGSRTLRPESVRDITEGKFIDAVRSVAAEMTMEELHEKRKTYAAKIQDSLNDDLSRNGLALESVSVTALDQTSMEYFDPSNAFDAEGLTRLTETIEQRKKKRNDIEQDTQVQIKNKNLETEKLNLSLEREGQFARLEQELEIESRKAEQMAEIARQRSAQTQAADEADIEKTKKVEIAKILSEREVEEERIDRERALREREIEKDKSLTLAEQLSDQEISKGSLAQMKSKVEAEKTRAVLVATEEQVLTAREKEAAERRKAVAIVEAAKEAEREAVALKLLAEANKIAASDKAEADKIKASADEIRYKTDAEGERILNEARNLLSVDHVSAEVRKYLIDHLPEIIRESSEPLKNIESIRVVQTGGLGSSGSGGDNGSSGMFDGALRYRAQAPIVDALLKDLGLGVGGAMTPETDSDKK